MKKFGKYIIFLCFTVIVLTSFPPGHLFAEELPSRIGLDLSVPPVESKEEGIMEEKYREILDEISISPEAEEVVEHIKHKVSELQDLQLDFHLSRVKGRRTEEILGKISASVEHKVARIEFFQPDALRGLIVVIDQDKMVAKTFRPVTNQIEVEELEDVSKEAFSALNISNITSYFDFTQYDVALLDTTVEAGVTEYFLQVEGWQDQDLVQVRVKDDTLIPWEVQLFEQEAFVGKIQFTEILVNSALKEADLVKLPKVKEVKM